MYTVCDMEFWRSDYFDVSYCEVEYGVFDTYQKARKRADEIDGIVIQLD